MSRVRFSSSLSLLRKPLLPPMNSYIVNTVEDLTSSLGTITPTSQSDIFNTWGRFSGNQWYDGGVTPPGTSEARSWTYNASLGYIQSTLNSNNVIGFISPSLTGQLEYYTETITVGATGTDNDAIGAVIAFTRVGLVNHALIAFRCQKETNVFVSSGYGPAWGIYDFTLDFLDTNLTAGNPTIVVTPVVNGNTSIDTVTSTKNWSVTGISPTIIKISRNSDNITVWTSQNGSTSVDTTTSLSYTLPTDSIYRGPQCYGYAAYSQDGAYFKDISLQGGFDTNIIYDVTSGTPTVYVWNGSSWGASLTHNMWDDLKYPRVVTNPATSKSFLISGPAPYNIVEIT